MQRYQIFFATLIGWHRRSNIGFSIHLHISISYGILGFSFTTILHSLQFTGFPAPVPTTIKMIAKSFTPVFCLLVAANTFQSAEAFSTELSRRQVFVKTANVVGGVASTVALPSLATAEVSEETPRLVTRMGGLLVGFIFCCCDVDCPLNCCTTNKCSFCDWN